MLFHDRITERGRDLFKNRCRKQKGLHLLWLSLQNFLSQIIENVVLISADLLQQSERISTLWQRKMEQLETHQPAFCANCYLLNCLLRQIKAHDLVKKGCCLFNCTTQLISTDFLDVLACSEL